MEGRDSGELRGLLQQTVQKQRQLEQNTRVTGLVVGGAVVILALIALIFNHQLRGVRQSIEESTASAASDGQTEQLMQRVAELEKQLSEERAQWSKWQQQEEEQSKLLSKLQAADKRDDDRDARAASAIEKLQSGLEGMEQKLREVEASVAAAAETQNAEGGASLTEIGELRLSVNRALEASQEAQSKVSELTEQTAPLSALIKEEKKRSKEMRQYADQLYELEKRLVQQAHRVNDIQDQITTFSQTGFEDPKWEEVYFRFELVELQLNKIMSAYRKQRTNTLFLAEKLETSLPEVEGEVKNMSEVVEEAQRDRKKGKLVQVDGSDAKAQAPEQPAAAASAAAEEAPAAAEAPVAAETKTEEAPVVPETKTEEAPAATTPKAEEAPAAAETTKPKKTKGKKQKTEL